MIPQVMNAAEMQQDFEFVTLPSRTFRLNTEQQQVSGQVDQLAALKQAVYLILHTERYAWLIHSWNYGVELADLIGQPVDFCLPEIERRIREALLQDDRIQRVANFRFEIQKTKVLASFEVQTIFGGLAEEMEVNI